MNLSETVEVLAAVADLQGQGRPMALATIVSVTGSTYRRPGARLLVPDEGDAIGNLSGGCLEGQVTEIGRDVMKSGESRLEFYDLTADDEVVWGWGLGCNGAIEVFIEPAANAFETVAVLREALEEERSLATVTVLTSSIPGVTRGGRMVVYSEDTATGSLGDEALTKIAAEEAARALDGGTTGAVVLETPAGETRVFMEVLRPPLRLVVCGAGHDAIPLVRAGAQLGWRVDVVDDRASFLDADRFPGARAFIECEPSEVSEKASIDDHSYFVVMRHN
jgi:xanthine dehydrogenase accessory factor